MRFRLLKRDFRLFMRCLLPAAALTAIFTAVCVAATLVTVKGAQEVYTPVKAAVVDCENSLFSRLVVKAVARMDYVADLMDISLSDMDKAMEDLREGELAAVIILPENTVNGILSGTDTRGTIYLLPAAAAHADVVAGAAAFGELMLAAGQYGIFSGEQLIWEQGMEAQLHEDFLNKYNARLMSEALEANSKYFTVQVTDYVDTNMATVSYYALCWLTLLLLLTAMFFSRLYTEDFKRPTLCRLRSLGIADGEFLLGKVLYPFTFGLILTAAVLIGASEIAELNVKALPVLSAIAGVLLAAVVGGFTVMTCENGVSLLAALSVAGLILCGGVIPRQLLPDLVLLLGSVTPYGAVSGLLAPIFGGRLDAFSALAALVYSALLPAVVCVRMKRIRIGGDAV